MSQTNDTKTITSRLNPLDAPFRTVADHVPVLIWMSGSNGLFRYVNRSWLDFAGRPLEAELGNGWQKSVHPDDLPGFARTYQAALSERIEFTTEIRVRRHDGQFRWLSHRGVPVTGDGGEFHGFIGTCTDITEQRELISRGAFLLEVDNELHALADPDQITLAAARSLGAYLDVNRCAYAEVEGDEDTFKVTGDYNNGVNSIIGRYTFTQFGADCLRLMREGKPYVVSDSDIDPRTADVRESYRLTRIRSVVCVPLIKRGKFVGAMAVHQISPRSWRSEEIELVQQMASRCWESIQRSRISRELQSRAAVVESSTDAIITKTLDGVITSWNESAQRVFGYTASEAIGQPVTMLFPADHINEETEIVRRIRRGERVDHYETIRRKKDGTLIPISLTISPIRNDNDEIVGASKTARDISSQKAYEARLIEQADELEQFAYVASHDLQEPLRKLGVYSDLLISRYRETAGPEAEKYTGFIGDAVSRMRRLINELLTYSRANRDVAPTEPVSLSAVLKGAIADLEVAIAESHATVSAGELPDVQANPFQVHQVIQNLLSNAVKFRSSRPPEIHVSATMSGNDVVVSVKDNGIGIEPEYKEKVFRVFQRLNSGNRYPGTGIGLAICKKIIEHHGGRIWVESRLGEGSTFYFTFPKSFSTPIRP